MSTCEDCANKTVTFVVFESNLKKIVCRLKDEDTSEKHECIPANKSSLVEKCTFQVEDEETELSGKLKKKKEIEKSE